jgi:transcriptional regulator with XRE-family HTH domain
MTFQERITEVIQSSQYTQKEIARILHISEGNITNWKKGENSPSLEILFKLCVLLGESADYLLGLEDEVGERIAYDTSKIDELHFS